MAIFCVFASMLLGQTASMPDTMAFVGGSVSIPVMITDVVDLEGLELTVQYDEIVLMAMSTSFENTELDDMNFNISVGLEISGEIMVAVYAGTNQFFSGSGTLLFINFDVIGQLSESTDLTFTSIEINNINILVNSENGSVTLINAGCMEIDACNYNENAVIDDDSCVFESDCFGECGGSASLDDCGICSEGNTGLEANADDLGCGCFEPGPSGCDEQCGSTFESDCAGICGGSAVEDCAGICGGSAVEDCTGVCGGSAVEDCAGVCDGSAVEDCAGVCDGSAFDDSCGVCGGSGVDVDEDDICDDVDSCIEEAGLSQECGCNTGLAEGACDCDDNILDICGVCAAGGSDDLGCGCFESGPSGCNNECGSTAVEGCDGVCDSGLEFDECDECGGSGVDVDEDDICDDVDDCIEETGASQECGCNTGTTEGECLSIENSIPESFSINSIYPNPFNPIATINYSIAIFSVVNISIYSINGELIETLVHLSKQPGQYAVQWNASNFPSGLYFVKLFSENKIAEQKVLLIK